ncbi:MAG: DUF3592 domain-containing protein [Acutalibacteraceae bacterium]|nr:DUF3592 domain-containing protein [Acutalibacteraceae bacterium]
MDNQVYSEGTPLNPKYKKYFYMLFIGFCVLFTVIVLAVTIPNQQKYNFLVECGKSTQGEVTSVSRSDSEDPYKVKGHYTVGENVYKFSCSSDSYISIGSFCTILYEVENPSNYMVDGIETDFTLGYLSAVLGLVMGSIMLFLWSLEWRNNTNVNELEVYNRNSSAEKRRKYIEETGDVWNIDLTNEERNEKLYRSRQTTSNYNANSRFVRGNVGTTAFYGKDNDSSNL